MIRVNDLSKRFAKFSLKDMTFEIPKGYICGVVGLNGSGKTTLLHLLLGLYKPSEGEIFICDKTYENAEKEIRDSIGTVLCEDMFVASATVKKNADYYGSFYSNYDSNKFSNLIKEFEVNEKARFEKLSKGEKLKCQYAFALAVNPKLLILDEPSANFDPAFRKYFLKSVKDFIADGEKTVIITSHQTDDIDMLADYLIYIDNGNQVYAGDIESFRSAYRIVSGENYKIKLLDKADVISMEERKYETKALVKHREKKEYDRSLTATVPSIEEFMYFYSKRED